MEKDDNQNFTVDPNFADPNEYESWNPRCNLEQSGDSEHKIDLADLAVFVEEVPWLWRACWKQSQLTRFETLYYSQTAENLFFESTDASFSSSVTGTKDIKISELNTIEKSIVQILAVVEKGIQEGTEHPNIEGLAEIKVFLEDCLVDIRSRK